MTCKSTTTEPHKDNQTIQGTTTFYSPLLTSIDILATDALPINSARKPNPQARRPPWLQFHSCSDGLSIPLPRRTTNQHPIQPIDKVLCLQILGFHGNWILCVLLGCMAVERTVLTCFSSPIPRCCVADQEEPVNSIEGSWLVVDGSGDCRIRGTCIGLWIAGPRNEIIQTSRSAMTYTYCSGLSVLLHGIDVTRDKPGSAIL